MFGVSVLTEELELENHKFLFGSVKRAIKKIFGIRKSSGHPAVIESLSRGLVELGLACNFNPKQAQELKSHVLVLSNVEALRQGIALKEKGLIEKLYAGPNLMIWSNQYDGILANKNIDGVLLPSDWTILSYAEDLPAIKDKISLWYSGVNEKYWLPSEKKISTKKVLLYWKTEDEKFIEDIKKILKENNFSIAVVKYGEYNKESYKDLLNQVDCAVFVSRSESQGLALAEAWSMNVPTFCWDPGELTYEHKVYKQVSSCPYLNEQTGARWKGLEELGNILTAYQAGDYNFSPRQWILENMTDKRSVEILLKVIKNNL